MNHRTQHTSSQCDERHLTRPIATQVGPVALRQGNPVLVHGSCVVLNGTEGYPGTADHKERLTSAKLGLAVLKFRVHRVDKSNGGSPGYTCPNLGPLLDTAP
jgi:hypothetical protein